MSRTLLVQAQKNFKVTIPDNAKVTFGPWSPPSDKTTRYDNSDKALAGTLRVYENHTTGASVLAVFSGVTGYRDLALDYAEEVAVEQGATIWKTDKDGYHREDNVTRSTDWLVPVPPTIAEPKHRAKRKEPEL